MKFFSRQFGELECDDDLRLAFPKGIIGFEEWTEYVIVHDEDSEPFRWLVSTQNSDLCLPLINPLEICPEYNPSIPSDGEECCELFAVVCLRASLDDTTANLKSPIVINPKTQSGQQIILLDDHYLIAQKVF
jgi:flagellar assembly factor FliW